MKVRHTLICFFLLSLQDGNNGLVNAQIIVYTGTEGGDVRVKCTFSSSRRRKFFCKEKCKQKDILIETTGETAQKGRYSIDWRRKQASTGADLFVTVTQLTKSDSGRYRCGLGKSLKSASYKLIKIILIDAHLVGNPSQETTLYTRTGGNIVVECFFNIYKKRKYLCKGECEEKDVLVETTDFRARTDRYSIEYVEGSSTVGSLFVSITQLTKSDSGQYRCGLNKRLSQDLYREFKIIVTDDPTSKSVPSASTATTTTQTTQQSAATTTTDVLLYVVLTLVIIAVLLSLALLIFCRKRPSKNEEPPVQTEYASVTETSRAYEDIREDRPSRSPPVEISSVYTLAKYTKRSGGETNDDYSSVTAASPQNTAENDSSELTYSGLNFSNQTVGSRNSALPGDGDNVIYSAPRIRARSDASHAEDVYSTVT